MSPVFPNSIEVFDLAENQDLSPVEVDPEKLAHKYKEVFIIFINCILSITLLFIHLSKLIPFQSYVPLH